MSELFPSSNAVEARREWEIEMIKERLNRNESVDTPVCRVEKDPADSAVLRFGLKRGKLLYLFKYPSHDVERDKHRNVITRARFIKTALERSGYRLVPWDFKKAQTPTFWQDSRTMEHDHEEEDDDLYGPSETVAPVPKQEPRNDGTDSEGDQPMDEGLETAEDDDEDSDSDLEIIIDKPQAAAQPPPQTKQESKAIKIEAPNQTQTPSTAAKPASSSQQQQQIPGFGTGQPGTAYPAVRTSTVDVNADPVYPPAGKPVTQIDIDADLAESTKPWRLPGADQSDYFNYGFDEFTWEMYRQRQTSMANTIQNQKNEMAQFQSIFMPGMGGPPVAQGGPGGVPGAPTGPSGGQGGGMPAGPGAMPEMSQDQMMAMMSQMQAGGMDMSNMGFDAFMQMAGGMNPGGFPGGGGQQQGNYGGGGQGGGHGGGGRGSGRRGRGGW